MRFKSMLLFCFLLILSAGYGQNTNPFTIDIGGNLSYLSFDYLIEDRSTEDFSYLSKITTYYVDPATNEEVFLFLGEFDGSSLINHEYDSEVTGSQGSTYELYSYYLNMWEYPKNLDADTLVFHVYETWHFNEAEDSLTYNPMTVSVAVPVYEVDLYIPDHIYVGESFYPSAYSDDWAESMTWEIEGQEPVVSDYPNFTITETGTYDLSITSVINGETYVLNFPDKIVVEEPPVSPFTFTTSNNDSSITFIYLTWDQTSESDYSRLDEIKTYYVDPETGDEVSLFSAHFQGDYYYMQENVDEISWDGTQTDGVFTYYENTWTYPADLNADTITFHVYASWYYGEYLDTESANPLVVEHDLTRLDIQLYPPDKVYAGVAFFMDYYSEDEIDSWVWEIEGQEPIEGQGPEFVINNAGVYDLTLTVTANEKSYVINYPDYFTVEEAPVSPFTFASSNDGDNIKFSYLALDETIPEEYSTLNEIKTYYVDPETGQEVFLFQSYFDYSFPYSSEAAEEISWDGTNQLDGALTYYENTWTYSSELNVDSITFHVYATWGFEGYEDSVSANPLVVAHAMPQMEIQLYPPDKVYAGVPFFMDYYSEDEFDSWVWEIEGQEPIEGLSPELVIDSVGVYDLTLTVTSNGRSAVFNYPDYFNVAEAPVSPFTIASSDDGDNIKFSYLVSDETNPEEYSSLMEIKTYYVDPETDQEVFLFQSYFDGSYPYSSEADDGISWDGAQQSGDLWYFENTWTYPQPLNVGSYTFNVYATWGFNGYEDSVSTNPFTLVHSIQNLSVDVQPLGKIYAGIPFDLNVTSENSIDSWTWAIGGLDPVNQQNPTLSIDTVGSYSAILTVSSNAVTQQFSFPDLITVLPVPESPFTVETTEENDVIKFKYLIADQSSADDESELVEIAAFYVDPETNEEIALFSGSFDGLSPVDTGSSSSITWDGAIADGTNQYYETSYSYPNDLTASSLTFKVYAIWSFNGLKDSTSFNPVVLEQPIPQFTAEVSPLGKLYAGFPFTLSATSNQTTESWMWEVSGQAAQNQQTASFTIETPGTYDATLTLSSGGNTRVFNYAGLITVQSMPDLPFTVSVSEENDVISFQYLIADQSSTDDSSEISTISISYVDPDTNEETSLFSSTFDGQTPTQQVAIDDVNWIGTQQMSNQIYYRNTWNYPNDLYATSLKFRVYATWNYNGYEDATSFNPVVVTQTIPQVAIQLSSLGKVYTGIPVQLKASTSNAISSWKWEVDGQEASTAQNPTYTFSEAGNYSGKLTVVSNGHTRVFNYPNLVSVEQAPVLTIGSDFPQQVEPNIPLYSKFSATGAIGTISYSAIGLPDGAALNSTSGLFTWLNPEAGTYEFTIKLKDGSREVTKQISFSVLPSTSNVSFSVNSNLGDKLENAFVKIDLNGNQGSLYLLTNDQGVALVGGTESANVELQNDVSYPVSVFYSDWPAYKTTVTVSKDTVCAIVISATSLVLQDVMLQADQITKSGGKYTLTGNVSINDLMFFEGSNSVLVDNTKDNMPIISTKNSLRVKGGVLDRELLPAGANKEFYLYAGMLIPTNRAVSFNVGDICNIPMRGYVLSFYDEGVEFATFPKLPWIIGDFVTDAGYFFTDKLISLIRAGNLDFATTMEVTGLVNDEINAIVDSISAKKAAADTTATTTPTTPTATTDTTKAKGRIGKLFEKFEGLSISIPTIEVKRYLDINAGETQDVTIEDLAVCKNGIGLQGFSASYEGLDDYFECSANLVWGGDCEGDDDRSADASFSEMRNSLVESFDEFEEMGEVAVEVQDQCGTVIYHSTYDEFVDITGELAIQELDERGLPISGFGVEFAIKAGKIDKIIISVDVDIPIASTPFKISNITGGVDKLTNTVNGVTSYSTKNMVVSLACDIEDTSDKGILAFRSVGLSIQPFSYFGGSGALEIAGQEIAEGSLSFDNNKKMFSTNAVINVKDMFTGKGEITITGSSMSGLFNLNVKTPSSLPTPFGWASNMSLGSAAVAFSGKMVGAKVAIGKEVTTYETVEVRGWWSRVKKAAKAAAKAVVKVVTYVTKKVVSMLSFEVGIGYDFANNKLLFGENVKIPSTTRMCYRGDTLIHEFNITEDTRLLYVMVSNGGAEFVDFDLYDNNNALVDENAVWCQDSTNYEIIAVVPQPGIGTWTVKVDTTLYQNVQISPMYFDNVPQGTFVSPTTVNTTETEIMLKFNDTNDTLNVSVFVDDDLADYNGTSIADFKILNNANVKFTYKPTNLKPGEYYFYYRLSDGSNIPTYQYASGSLVIPSGNIPAPSGVKNELNENNLTIYWDAADSTLVDYVNVELLDLFTGEKSVIDVPEDSVLLIESLKYSRNYQYSVRNYDFDGNISTAVEGTAFILASTGNNAPVWNTKNDKIYEVFETDTLKITIDVSDPDGDAVSLAMTGALPKEMSLNNGILQWNTDVDDRGLYDFKVVANDGTIQDTLQLRVFVKPIQQSAVELSFASGKLYEEDNMFLSLNDPKSTDATKVAWLLNLSKNDSVQVDLTKVNSTTYQGNFQLSYQRRSILPVSDGDTLIAVYYTPTDTIFAIAFFDSIPQISDNIAPNAISDLEATLIGEQVQLVFTVPEDRMDNNLMNTPWSYDLRYTYQSLDNETTYLGAYTIDGLEVGQIGTKDTVMVALADLYDQDKYHRVWFNIKAGDTKFNFAELSNTVFVDYVSEPVDLVAEIQDDYTVDLVWDGPEKLVEDDYFEYYEVYRKINEGEYFLLGRSETTEYTDVPGAEVEDGIFTYLIRGIYSESKTNPVISNNVDYNRYSDIQVVCVDERATRSITTQFDVKVIPINNTDAATESTDAEGIAYFSDLANGDYQVVISLGEDVYVDEVISVMPESTNFVFSISSIVTSVNSLNDKGEIRLYPNPVSDRMTIDLNELAGEVNTITIVSLDGTLMQQIVPGAAQLVSFDASRLSKGVYVANIVTDYIVVSKLFVVE